MVQRKMPAAEVGEVIVADDAALQTALEELSHASHIGLDTEFVGELTYRPDLCLIQLSTVDQLYIIDPLACRSVAPVWDLLADPSRLVIVHAGREELRACHFAIGRPPAHIFDIQLAAGLVGYTWPMGYGTIVQELLGIRTGKGETLTDWRRRPLTAAQLRYAFDDVRHLIPIWKKLHDKLRRLNREDWAAEEFAAFARKAINDDAAVEKWRKLKGLGGFSRKELAVARAVHAWRDGVAERQNRPVRSVVRDEVLVEIARRAPTTEEAIANYRGIPKGLVGSLLEAIRVARGLPTNEHPEYQERDNDPPHVQLLATLLNVVLQEWCGRNKLAANLVATMSDLRGLVRARQPGGVMEPSQLTHGWRERAVLPELIAFLDGRRSVLVADAAAANPLAVAAIAEGT